MWAATVIPGWAIVYWPHMAWGGFSPGSKTAQESALLDSVYLSLVTVATLGLGDISPGEGWLRLVSPLEALVGFALLTATVSWVLEIYPALTRRRVLAIRAGAAARLRPGDAADRLHCGGTPTGQPGLRSRTSPDRLHPVRRGVLLPRRGGPRVAGGNWLPALATVATVTALLLAARETRRRIRRRPLAQVRLR
jgi:hypothetical protein